MNVSFYRLPKKEVFEAWYKRTPKRFLFTVKGSRFITHIKRLKDCRDALSLLFDHASPLKEKLGVVLWQLPPRFTFQKERLESFCVLLSTLPRAKLHRHAFEFRDESWFCNEAFGILEDFRFAFCMAHGSGLPFIERITSDFIYLRFHGGDVLYGSNYSDKELKRWAGTIQNWRKKDKTAFIYFNNDAYGFAVQLAEVRVDTVTGRIEVPRMVTFHDCGFPLNRSIVEGQVHGNVSMGLGQALWEEVLLEKGQMQNPTFLDYRAPLAAETPEMVSGMVETSRFLPATRGMRANTPRDA